MTHGKEPRDAEGWRLHDDGTRVHRYDCTIHNGDGCDGHCGPVHADPAEATRYTADVVAVTPDGRVLLIERDWPPYEGQWALPGGHVDPTDAGSREAAARELAEETGVRVAAEQLQPVGRWDQPGRDPRGRYITDVYLAEVPAGTPIAAGSDARTARWWPLKSLPEPLGFDHADILAKATAGR
jgi:8-oxo-dGTP diphosphatase